MTMPILTKRQRQILQAMADAEDREDYENAELVSEGRVVYLGLTLTSCAVVKALVRLVFITCDDLGSAVQRWTINGSGRRFLQGLPPYYDSEGRCFESFFELLAANKPKKKRRK